MSIWKIVSGIISIVLCFFVIFQSCAAGLVNALTQNGDVSGSAGLLVAVLLLVGGIVAIATRDAISNGGNIAVIIIYGIAAAIGYLMAGIYTDLVIWATWCVICAVVAAMAIAADNVCSAWVYIVIAIIGVVIAVGGFGMNLNSDDQEPAPKKEQVLDVIPKDDSGEDEKETEKNQPESDNDEIATGAGNLGDYDGKGQPDVATYQPPQTKDATRAHEPAQEPEPEEKTADPESATSESLGEQNALAKAKDYLAFMAFSRSGLAKQLEFDGFTREEAAYGAEQCGADWTEQAVKKAESYLSTMAFSHSGLAKQLEFDGFTSEEAAYGVENCGADWNEQAAKKAQSYLATMSFSKSGLVKQLEFDGFTSEQAEYGVTQAGF